VRLETSFVRARLRAPFFSASQRLDTVRLTCLHVIDADGVAGHGEAVEPDQYPDRLRAALDLALLDLAGRRTGQPVWRLLGAVEAPAVEVNATIAAADPQRAAAEAAVAREAGFRCVKVKVGLPGDLERVTAVRSAAGPEMSIRLDANGAWSVEEAIAALSELEPIGIELCEEPTSGLASIERVCAQTSVPISVDESASDPGALDRRVCDAVCLKIARRGGITGLLDAASRARTAGYRVYLASMLDGPLGIAAALHAAVVVRPDLACGLGTLSLFEERSDPLPARGGRIAVPSAPGLGEGLLDWYGV
jgi:L-Ala-D/L-Glu epimerase